MHRHHTAAVLLALALVAGCASRTVPSSTYAQLGGAAGVEGIVDDLLNVIVDDERINQQFANADILRLREKLIEQICAKSDGPCTYTGLTMEESHAGRHITDAQTIQRRKSIRPQLDTGADFTDFMRLLQQHHFDPLARQRERRRRAANAAADDNCSRHFRHLPSSLGRNFVLLIFRRGGDKRR